MKIIGWDPGRMYDKGYSVSNGKEIKTLNEKLTSAFNTFNKM